MRKHVIVTATAIAILGLSFAGAAHAQGRMHWKGAGGWGMHGHYHRMYDASTIVTVSGEIVAVEQFTPMPGMSAGVHVKLKTDHEIIAVHLGPVWYLENQGDSLKQNERIDVTGSRINFQGQPVIVAAELRRGDQVLRLRDQTGYPAWMGWRHRHH